MRACHGERTLERSKYMTGEGGWMDSSSGGASELSERLDGDVRRRRLLGLDLALLLPSRWGRLDDHLRTEAEADANVRRRAVVVVRRVALLMRDRDVIVRQLAELRARVRACVSDAVDLRAAREDAPGQSRCRAPRPPR